MQLSIDHIIPRYQSGTDAKDNLATCCNSCNSITSRMSFETGLSQAEIVSRKAQRVREKHEARRPSWLRSQQTARSPSKILIANAVTAGIEDADVEFHYFCGEPLKLAPEYLVTVNVARRLRAASERFKVHLEHSVDAALKGAGSSKPGVRATSERRSGRLDILVTEREKELCVVEIKNPTCWEKTIHDMERLRTTLLHATWGSSIRLGVIAFPPAWHAREQKRHK